MSRAIIEQLLYIMDEAFEGAEQEHSLLGNLRPLREDDWDWLPSGGARSIFEIVRHVGECKYVYVNHAFGDASMRWDRPGTVPTVESETGRPAVIEWLREGQRRWRGKIADLNDDDQLLRPRRANWGREYETRWLVNVLIQHDLYHAGEINHIRALRHGNDRWAWESE